MVEKRVPSCYQTALPNTTRNLNFPVLKTRSGFLAAGFFSETMAWVCPNRARPFVVFLKAQKSQLQPSDKKMSIPNSTSEFLLLFRGSGGDRSLSPAELQKTMAGFLAWFERLSADGTLKAGQPLLDDARIVSGKNGRTVADGPFAESKEAVGGYFLIQAASLEDAVAIAQQCPMLECGTVVEVRPIAASCPTLHRARELIGEELAPVGA